MVNFSEDFLILPKLEEIETPSVLRRLSQITFSLGNLNGARKSIPNPDILLSSLYLMEAKASSEIENIVTTHDDIYKGQLEMTTDPAAKEVRAYSTAMRHGMDLLRQNNLLSINNILQIQEIVEENNAGFRKIPSVNLKNQKTGEIVYSPPSPDRIIALIAEVERLINDDSYYPAHPLIKMAIIHYQFETIHPFYDGNGRTGRIINILYLVKQGLLEAPILYLSRYINRHREDYYRLLQDVHLHRNWKEWIEFMLKGIEGVAEEAITTVNRLHRLLAEVKKDIRDRHKLKFYRQDLLNHIFSEPYTKARRLEKALGVSYLTASRYLDALAKSGVLEKHKHGRENYYVNHKMIKLLWEESADA